MSTIEQANTVTDLASKIDQIYNFEKGRGNNSPDLAEELHDEIFNSTSHIHRELGKIGLYLMHRANNTYAVIAKGGRIEV